VILLEVDAIGVAALEFKRDAPRPVDVHRVSLRLAMQGMEVEAVQVHVLRARRPVERIKPAQTALLQRFLNPRRRALLEHLLETLVPEAADHADV
jgi:hypothetical protein